MIGQPAAVPARLDPQQRFAPKHERVRVGAAREINRQPPALSTAASSDSLCCDFRGDVPTGRLHCPMRLRRAAVPGNRRCLGERALVLHKRVHWRASGRMCARARAMARGFTEGYGHAADVTRFRMRCIGIIVRCHGIMCATAKPLVEQRFNGLAP
jgi:hypothetical protein